MKLIRETGWLVGWMLVFGSAAVPPQSQAHFRGSMKAKQTTPSYVTEEQSAGTSMIGSSNSSEGKNAASSATVGPSTVSGEAGIASSASSPIPILKPILIPISVSISTARNSPVDAIESLAATTSSPASSMAGTGELGESTTATGTTIAARRSTTGSGTSGSNAGSSAVPTETSSRTIVASTQDASTFFLSSSKKSTTSFNDLATTPSSISPKETRESTGKIRPQIKLTTNYTSVSETGVRLPEGASAALAKPTKYHYYPHNQHIYLLPECAVQQVCNAVYVRLNFTQPLCACPGRYRDPCSASLDSDDLHTTELVTDPRTKALTLVKTCEPVAEMRECRTPRDWSLLALQNIRTGKSHYLVICRCPDANILEGPMSHDQPTYASVPGIRVYGMMCVQGNRRSRPLRYTRSLSDHSEGGIGADSMYKESEETDERLSFPWYKVQQLMDTAVWD